MGIPRGVEQIAGDQRLTFLAVQLRQISSSSTIAKKNVERETVEDHYAAADLLSVRSSWRCAARILTLVQIVASDCAAAVLARPAWRTFGRVGHEIEARERRSTTRLLRCSVRFEPG
jgi:hypothetical protein